MENNSKQQEVFVGNERTSITRYGVVLLGVHDRLVIEGYFLDDGKTWDIFKIGTIVGRFEVEDYY